MANNDRPRKKSPTRQAQGVPPAPGDTDQEFFAKVKVDAQSLTADPSVLLNIPVWGWQYSGKTCAILTAVHYCQAQMHGIGLARVKDMSDLNEMASKFEAYRGLQLATLAEATSTRLSELSELFFVDLEWPPGTDSPMHYLLEVRTVAGPLGFVLFPDIMGGSYEKADDLARNAIADAHAMIILVDADDYQATTPQAKEYQDAVLGVIQRCAKQNIPTCVMITKSDEHEVDTKPVDDTFTLLTTLLEGQKKGFLFRILRVSAIGEANGNDWSKAPPPAAERNPEKLVLGWVWALHKAIASPRDEALKRVPRTNLKGTPTNQATLATTSIPELRIVRHQTGSQGAVIAATPTNQGTKFILLDKEQGALRELVIDENADTSHVGTAIPISNWEPPEDIVAATTASDIYLGSRQATVIWYGTNGQSLTRTPFPYPMLAWSPIGDRMLAGLDDKGTIHTLSFSKGKWVDRDYRNAFMPGANLAMKHITRESIIVAHNGTAVAAVRVGDKAKLDALLTIDLAVRYDSPKVSINETSLVAAMKADQTLVAGRDQEHALGKAHAEAPVPFAIAENADIVGWMSADGRLHAADLSGNRLRITTPAHSPKPSELPSGMVWSRDGSILVVTFPNGTWLWARRLGF